MTELLEKHGFRAAALNGDMTQQLREQTLDRLRNGSLDIVVATDVAARGIDIERISLVVNYDIPLDAESYVHRITVLVVQVALVVHCYSLNHVNAVYFVISNT